MSKLSILALFLSFFISSAQTTHISPSGDGGFENGSTFAANGWTNASSANNPWVVGTAVASAPILGNSAYISNNGGATNAYTPADNASNFFWRDVTVPAGENVIRLTFNWICQGESTFDNWQVFYAPTSVVPIGSTTHPGSGATNVPAGIAGATWLGNGNLQGTVQTTTILLPASLAGTTFRLIFHWKNETGGTQPPASIDNISLTSRASGTFTSIATGNWSSPATWDANDVPTVLDDAIVSTSNIVAVDAIGQAIDELTVNGTLTYGVTPVSFNVANNLTVAVGGFINVFNGTTGKTLVVSGNIVNNGTIDLSVSSSTSATTQGNLTLNGSLVQTVSGTGIFGGTVSSTTATNTVGVIRHLVFANTNTSIPNINWNVNNVRLMNGIVVNANNRVNLNGNKIYFGNFGSFTAGTVTVNNANSGFYNGSISRWWTNAQTGTGITAGTDPTNSTSRYPFINTAGQDRALYVTRSSSTVTGNTAGYITAVYNDVAGITTGLNITDGAYTITDRTNGNWVLSTENGYVYVSGTHTLVGFYTGGLSVINNAAARLMNPTATVGAFQNGSTTPGTQRTTLTTAQITTEPFHIGINAADIPFVPIVSGDWNTASTWNKGSVPTCTDFVTITNGFNVTSSTAGNVCKNLTVASGGTLNNIAGDLSVGCTFNNNLLVNNGTLTVSGGTLTVRGSLNHNVGAIFNQSAGDIIIDGNDAGIVANSATSYHLNLAAPVNWTGGNLSIIDPHAATASTDVLYYNSSISSDVAPAHTIIFGNGASTDAGGNVVGFKINTYVGSGRINFGNGVVNTGTGTNRILSAGTYSNVYRGNLTINTASEYSSSVIISVAGNLTNNGTLTQTGTLSMQNYSGTTASVNTNAQIISGSGVFRNLTAAPTANIASLTINNSNTSGVTLNIPLSVSGTLNLTSGLVNTTTANLLSLGTTTVAGTLTGGSPTAYINGPFARTIVSGNANTNYILFPVGKVAYAPISLAPTTTAVSVMKAEAFDSNLGTANASIVSLSSTRRWEAPLVSGTITNLNVRLGDAAVVASNIPVQAPAAAGEYTNVFGSFGTFTAGTPNIIQSNATVLSANYTGFLSYAISNACSGTPTPGATTATATTVCLDQSITLGITSVTVGTGVTYQWQSSPDGITYTDIAAATSATYVTTPTAATFYQCVVTCATGPASGTSTPIQITFTNSILTTVPGTRCGTGIVSLEATGTSGATINWYNAATGGTMVGTGSPFITPSISANTNYYAAAVTAGSNLYGGKLTPESSWTGSTVNNWGIIFTALQTTVLNSVDVYSTAAGTLSVKVTDASGVELYATSNINVLAGGTTTPTVIPLNFNIVQGATYKILVKASTGVSLVRGSTNLAFPYNNGAINVTSSEWGGTTTANYYYFYNLTTQSTCSSQRVQVAATVTTPPVFTLSTSSASICAGDSTLPVTITAGSTDFDTYVWSPITGVSGNAVAGWTFNPSATTSYTLTASQSGGALCSTIANLNITVNPKPTAITITPSPASTCVNSIQSLVATGGTINYTGSTPIGTATTLTTDNGTEPTAFNNRYKHYWLQMVFTAAELNAAGIQAGNINGVKFNITTIGSATNVSDFRVYMGNTALSALTGFVSTGLSQVYATPTYTQAIGVNSIVFNTPYVWDGTSNIIVDIRSTGVDTTLNSSTYYTATPDNKTVSAVTSTTFPSSNAYVASNPAGTLSLKRLNTTFDWSSAVATPITWSPITDLYTDAAATVAYVGGTNASTVYVKSATAATTTYTATATAPVTGCETTAPVDVTVTANSSLPNEVVSVCDTYTWAANGITYTTSGIYTNTVNCVTRTLDLTITPSTSNTTTVSACDAYHWTVNNTDYTSSGTYTLVTGCHTETLNLTITPSTSNTTTVSVCDAYHWTVNNTDYTSSGTYTLVTGCHTETLNLTITPSSSLPNEVVSVCDTYTWSANGTTYTTSGTYTNTVNCVTRTLDLTITTATTPTGAATQTLNGGVTADVTIEDIVVTGTGIVWYPTALDATNDTNAILAGTVLTDNTTYYAVSVNGTCRSAALAVTVTVVLGNASFDLSQLNYYPNPVKDIFNVKYSKEIISVNVYDLTGRKVIEMKPNTLEVQLNMTNLSNAMYIVRLQSVDGITELKVYKN